MKITQIRNATLRIEFAGKHFLVDPFLGKKGSYPPFPASLRQDQFNPLDDLPMPVEQILADLDAIVVTHLHLDHWDDAAKEILPKELPLFAQSAADAEEIAKSGFKNITVLDEDTSFGDIRLIKTPGEHGRGEVLPMAGPVCGVVFKHPREKTLYVAGDTVWYQAIGQTIEAHQPAVIVVNGGDNQFFGSGSLVMAKGDVVRVQMAAPDAHIVVSHMEAVNHWMLSRAELKAFLRETGIEASVSVPDDGQSYTF